MPDKTYLPSTQKLISNMQCLTSINTTQESLTSQHAPTLVADVDEDVAAAVESAERDFLAGGGGFDHLLCY